MLLTLPSNASLDKFPNTSTDFQTELYKELEMNRHELGLCELTFPHDFQPRIEVTAKSIGFGFVDANGYTERYYIPEGSYYSIGEMLESYEKYYMGDIFILQGFGDFRITFRRLVTSKKRPKQGVPINTDTADSSARHVPRTTHDSPEPYGLTPLGSVLDTITFRRVVSRRRGVVEFIFTPAIKLERIDKVYVYCDLIQPRPHGNKLQQLLRVVTVTAKPNENQINIFPKPYFFALARNNFRTIRIYLRDAAGNPIKFRKAPVTVTLRFRRRAVDSI